MSVQALHANASTAHSPGGLDEIAVNRGVATTSCVIVVRALEFAGVNQFLKSVDATVAFETTDGIVQLGIDEPEQSGHRCAVAQVRFVLDDDRATIATAHHHREAPRERSADQSLYEQPIIVRGVVKGQRQNSSVRSKRETNPLERWCVVDVPVDVAVLGAADDGDTSGWKPGSTEFAET